jgi:hypothetical protein
LHQVEVRLRLRAKNPDYLRPRYVWFFWGCCIILICTFLIIAIVEFSENLWVAAFFLLTDNGVYLLFWFLSPWEHSAKDSVGDTVLVNVLFNRVCPSRRDHIQDLSSTTLITKALAPDKVLAVSRVPSNSGHFNISPPGVKGKDSAQRMLGFQRLFYRQVDVEARMDAPCFVRRVLTGP